MTMRGRTAGLCVLLLALMLLAAPLAAKAQQAERVWRIGYLSPSEGGHNPIDEAFERSMKNLGYIEGQNIRLERRYTAGRQDQLASAAAELVRLNVDVIVVWSPAGTIVVKNATSAIPIVFLAGASGSSVGGIATLARPGGNLTGITLMADAENLEPKYLEMLRELVPKLSYVALLRVLAEATPNDAA
jgi:putative ABC transport system substrate-binding protein